MDAREIIIAFVDSCLKSQVISQTDLIALCGEDGCVIGNHPSPKQIQEAVDYLNSVEAVSDSNLSNVMRGRGIRFRYRATLRKCLRLKKFKYNQMRGTRTYYVKSPDCTPVTIEDIVL